MGRFRVRKAKMAETPTRYYCNYCQDELKSFSVRCCECTDFDLCLQCFSAGAELGSHKRDHDYQIIDNALLACGDKEWSMSEEYLLLDAIETFGFGNWADVASHIGSKSPTEAREHYDSNYICGNLGKAAVPEKPTFRVHDHTGPEDGPLSPTLVAKFTPVELTLIDQQELGYMPLRDDFEREYDNEAETLVSNLAITNEDDDLDIAIKLIHVDIYTRRLKERERRKKISREFGLITAALTSTANKAKEQKDQKGTQVQPQKRKPSKEETELREKMKVLAQFQSGKEQDEFFENLQKEKDIRARIKELIKYRRNGITKIEEVTEYEEAKGKRDRRKEGKKKIVRKSGVVSSKKTEPKEEPKKDDREIVEDEFQAIKSSPGFNFLSDREKRLCNSMKMKPARYITLKTVIIRDHLMRRQGLPCKTRYPSNLDKSHRKRITNYLTKSGWIKVS
ncbi:transcriptional adapter 2-beta-like [Asterias rubens]|uniref:transcriptional adapter 2-beta-like n=1 Tax=Asterias rubens TaxID=7604 RepID=UPI001455579E|nr:transcriptional adapter 2-beta-like [Asterias rubens]